MVAAALSSAAAASENRSMRGAPARFLFPGFMTTGVLLLLLAAPGASAPPASDCGTPYDCAIAQVQREEFADAIQALERILAKTPGDLKALNLLGIALTGEGKKDAANPRFR